MTLREAIRVLQAEGYVQTRRGPNAGLVLLPEREPIKVLRARLIDSKDELDAILDFREATEVAAARLAALRRTDEDLHSAEAAIRDLRGSYDLPTFRRADAAFHLAVGDAAKNKWLRDAIEDARAAMFSPLDVFDPTVPKQSSIQQLRVIRGSYKDRV